jgi:hypothetical protein
MQEAEYKEFSLLVKTTHNAIKETTKTEYLTIVQEENSIHFHLWFFPWTQHVIEHYGQSSLARIREIMADYRKQPVNESEWKEIEKSIEEMKALPKW